MPIQDDRFANILGATVQQGNANEEAFVEIQTGVSLAMGLGIVIDAIYYYPTSSAISELVAANDTLTMGLFTTNNISDLQDPSDQRIIDFIKLKGVQVGSVVSLSIFKTPIIHSLSPPIILAAPRLFVGMDGSGQGGAQQCAFRVHFRYAKLTTVEYLEIAETFIQLNA